MVEITKIINKTIASDIIPTKPKSEKDYYKEKYEALRKFVESRLSDDEYLSEGFVLTTGERVYSINKKPLKIDPYKCGKALEPDDWEILKSHGISPQEIDDVNLIAGYADRDDDIFIIRTSDVSWNNLAGRECHYNLKTKEFKLVRMN